MPLTSSIRAIIGATLTNNIDLAQRSLPVNVTRVLSLATGTGNGQADMIWSDQRTLGPSATENLDLAAGALLDPLTGAAMTFARVKVLLAYAAASNNIANPVQVTRPASNGVPIFMAAGDGVSLAPNAVLLIAATDATGFLVTAGTGDLITFTNGAGTNSVTYDVVIIGASA